MDVICNVSWGENMEHGFDPKILICTECSEEFVFTGAAQQYFVERGYNEEPKRCKSCHTKYKKTQRHSNGHRREAQINSNYSD